MRKTGEKKRERREKEKERHFLTDFVLDRIDFGMWMSCCLFVLVFVGFTCHVSRSSCHCQKKKARKTPKLGLIQIKNQNHCGWLVGCTFVHLCLSLCHPASPSRKNERKRKGKAKKKETEAAMECKSKAKKKRNWHV